MLEINVSRHQINILPLWLRQIYCWAKGFDRYKLVFSLRVCFSYLVSYRNTFLFFIFFFIFIYLLSGEVEIVFESESQRKKIIFSVSCFDRMSMLTFKVWGLTFGRFQSQTRKKPTLPAIILLEVGIRFFTLFSLTSNMKLDLLQRKILKFLL